MSHQLPECSHVWTGWSTEERKIAPSPEGSESADIVMYVLTRKCLHCGLIDEGKT